MSSLGKKLLSFLLSNKVVDVLSQEVMARRGRLNKHLLKSYGSNFYLAPYTVIFSPSSVTFGNDCAVNEFVHILGGGGVTIGNGVWIANHASLITETHPADVEFIGEHPPVTAEIVIDDHAWIGSHAVIMPGVTLGRSCIVAAGSIVTKDVPPYAIVAGVPAKILRYKSIRSNTILAQAARLHETEL